MNYENMSNNELTHEFEKIKAEYNTICEKKLSLDMSRGKPSFEQIDISNHFFSLISPETGFLTESGIDCRNYGLLDGIPELKKLFSEILEVPEDNLIVGGNSSLNVMFDTISQGMTHGFGEEPWLKQEKIKFLCPVPGYDRHFAICEYFNIEMIPIETNENGPNMDLVEELIKDKQVKGIWCVPKFSNPEGIVYSDEVVKRFAALKPAAKDFRIFWDNAYVVHGLISDVKLLNIFNECKKNNNDNLVIEFTSTSKITFPGGGVAALAASDEDIKRLKQRLNYQTIGPDKLNQLRHSKMFPNLESLTEHMKKHASILKPKFDVVLNAFEENLKDIASWTKPLGGYFISLTVKSGLAKRIHELCLNAGLVLTQAGATYPYGNDPTDSNLRIAPSYPQIEELKKACEVLCVAVKYATLENLISK